MDACIKVILALCLLIILLRFARKSNEIKRERERALMKKHTEIKHEQNSSSNT